jgi:predicted amidohydrolase
MRICVAQTRPIRGDILENIENHKRLIDLATVNGADMVIFPELSLTGYEPALSTALALAPDDRRLADFQTISTARDVILGVGAPTRSGSGICIGLVLFQPHQPRQLYTKKYLHPDEEAFFVSGVNLPVLEIRQTRIAFAICYELSVHEHSATAFRDGAEVYLASVAKTVAGTTKAMKTLADIASKYSMTVLMANCVGKSGDGECAGRSSIWNNQGVLLAQLDQVSEGVLLIDTNTRELVEQTL